MVRTPTVLDHCPLRTATGWGAPTPEVMSAAAPSPLRIVDVRPSRERIAIMKAPPGDHAGLDEAVLSINFNPVLRTRRIV